MNVVTIFLFALSVNIDNFVVGLSYGIKKIKILPLSNLLIAIISCIGTILSMGLGKIINKLMPTNIANITGNIILIVMGIWAVFNSLIDNKSDKPEERKKLSNEHIKCNNVLKNPDKVDKDNSGFIDVKESVILALALTLNNFGMGIGASIAGLNVKMTSLFTFIVSIVAITLGYMLGEKYLSKTFGKYTAIVSGISIIFLGIYELLTYQ